MAAPPKIDRFQPSFLRFPIQNNRTGFKPVYLPLILVVPGRRTSKGTPIGDTDVRNVKFFVYDAPEPAVVAGKFIDTVNGPILNQERLPDGSLSAHILVPQLSQFVVNVNRFELADVQILSQNHNFTDINGNFVDYADAKEGDFINYTLIRGDIASTIPYYPDADYYDVSMFTIDVEDLPKPKRYLFVWQCEYNVRIPFDTSFITTDAGFCVDSSIGVAQFAMMINHPGEVHNEMFRKTPSLYLNNNQFSLSADPVLEFYRPFADILQDIFDEQRFINGINHIDKIPAQLIPYLAFLIGWDLPNYPGVTDTVRQSILRQAVRLQKLKGSKRAIIEIFSIFGFNIELLNLWYSNDGLNLLAPGEGGIEVQNTSHTEPILSDYSTPGFGQFTVPLLHKPTGDITLNAWSVTIGSNTYTALKNIVDGTLVDETSLEGSVQIDNCGVISPNIINTLINQNDIKLVSETSINFQSGVGNEISCQVDGVLNHKTITFDNTTNQLNIVFDRYLPFDDNTAVFIFATYPYDKIIVPAELDNMRSNRFAVNILLKNGETPIPATIEFLMNFVIKLKAFHSLLKKIVFRIDNDGVYNVQDFCSDKGQGSLGTDITANLGDNCSPHSAQLGFTADEAALRTQIISALMDENESWKALDGRPSINDSRLNIPVNTPEGSECQYTQYGQDRVESGDVDLDHNADTRPKICITPTVIPNCFKGRVSEDLKLNLKLLTCEIVRSKPCVLGLGSGSYWLYPVSLPTNPLNLQSQGDSFLGKQISRYGVPQDYTLHYTDRPYLTDYQFKPDNLLAYRRPSLEIQKDNFCFPGHRFVTLNRLKEDFIHPSWRARPWDVDGLNPELIINDKGDEVLTFDDAELVYVGNGLVPDISSLGEHEDRSFTVTHKIFMVTEPNHPAISLDDSVEISSQDFIEFNSETDVGPIFDSYNRGCNKDYRNGYPAKTGRFNIDISQYDFYRGTGTDVSNDLDLPNRGSQGQNLKALFTLGSQILLNKNDPNYQYYQPYRLDCNCIEFGCEIGTGGTAGTAKGTGFTDSTSPFLNISTCNYDHFRLPNGTYDWNIDQLDISIKMKLQEQIGVCSTLLDGSIPNLIVQLVNGQVPSNLSIPASGSFRYRDDYSTLYEGSWININGKIDMSWTVKIPYVWGQPQDGYVLNKRVFVKGIITTSRQIILLNQNNYTIEQETSFQEIGYFQLNIACGDTPYVDNFAFHLECQVSDEVDSTVNQGARWTAVSDMGSSWGTLVKDTAGNVVDVTSTGDIFSWINVW